MFLTKLYTVDERLTVRWRWYGAGLPPYAEGEFQGSAAITLWPAAYLRLDFFPIADTNVSVTPL